MDSPTHLSEPSRIEDWKEEIARRAAEVEAQKVRLRLAVLVLEDVLRNRPRQETEIG